MVDAHDSKSCIARCESSSLSLGTIKMKNDKKEIIVVIGPTASGKSDFTVNLALKENGEIISADSRQVFKGLDIGTGKITKEEMKGIKHHMLDVYDFNEEVSVVRFVREASTIIEDIFFRGKIPIICGGTGQYINALIFDESFPPVKPNKNLREELEKLNEEELVARLLALYPKRLSNIDTKNRRRLIRAIEIAETLGYVPEQEELKLKYKTKIYLMEKTREELRERIKIRLDKRLEQGMLDEGKKVFEMNLNDIEINRLGIEYVAMNKYFKNEITLPEMKQEIITKSCQYAKRQQTWNKKFYRDVEFIK